MKIDDLVSIRVGREHRVRYGPLTEMKRGVGVVYVDGKRYVRDLKRIKPSSVGRREEAKKFRSN